MTPEPEGTRMPVVKGFADLLWCFLEPNLPPQWGPDRRLRRGLYCHHPKWRGDHWDAWFTLDTEDGPLLASIRLTPAYACRLLLYAADGVPRVLEADLAAHRPDDLQDAFHALANELGDALLDHLDVMTRIPEGVR